VSTTTASVHVHGVPRERFLALVIGKVEEDGFDLVDEASDHDGELRRVVINGAANWVALAADGLEPMDDWAAYLSIGLGAPVLSLWTWDGEASVLVKRFEDGREVARLELLREARRGEDGRARAPIEVLTPWIPPARRRELEGQLILDDGPGEVDADEAGADHAFVSERDSIDAIARLIGLPRPWLDVHDPDPDAGDIELEFQSRSAAQQE
jgi:hypothetical protein